MEHFILSGFSDEIGSNISVQFSAFKRLGIHYFEPRGINGKNISSLTQDEAKKLAEFMKMQGISASSIGSPIGKISIGDNFEAHLSLLKHTIAIAKTLGTKYIRIFSFFLPKEEPAEKYREEVLSRMKKMTSLAEENDVILLHENEKDIYGDIAELCLDLFREISSPNLRAVFDPANFVQCGQNTKDAFAALSPYVEYVHIKDALSNGNVVPAGQGDGNVEWILSQLSSMNYHGFLSLEPHLGSFEGLAALETTDKMEKLERSSEEKFVLTHAALTELLKRVKA